MKNNEVSSGHFALESHHAEIADPMRDFLKRTLKRTIK